MNKEVLTLKQFLHRYGTDTCTNFQLIAWAKDLKIKNFHYAMRDEIKKLKRIKKLPIYIIANYQTSIERGSHHVAMYKDINNANLFALTKSKNNNFYFDSYGIAPIKEALDFLGVGVYSNFKIQTDNSKMCSQLSLYLLYKLNLGYNYFDTVLEMYNEFH